MWKIHIVTKKGENIILKAIQKKEILRKLSSILEDVEPYDIHIKKEGKW